jgi:hypothetical protein
MEKNNNIVNKIYFIKHTLELNKKLSLNHEFKKLFLKREYFEKSIFHKKVIFLNIS